MCTLSYFSCVWLFVIPWTVAHQAPLSMGFSRQEYRSGLPCPYPGDLLDPGIGPLSLITSNDLISVIPFSSWLQSFSASESFPMSQSFASGGQSIETSASASVLPKNIQDLFPLGWTGLISLKSKGLSRVFSNTTAQKHQFSSVLAWRIPGMGEPGGLLSMGLQRIGHDWSNLAAAAAAHP